MDGCDASEMNRREKMDDVMPETNDMMRNEAVAFGCFDIGLGINFGGVQDNTYKPINLLILLQCPRHRQGLVVAARFDFLKKKQKPKFRRGPFANNDPTTMDPTSNIDVPRSIPIGRFMLTEMEGTSKLLRYGFRRNPRKKALGRKMIVGSRN
ncbi:hypothetical protein L6452_05927 [Arctium lappa]|uniref:Uncharacterized protein n=1 Tax=Arctium lappa TaxID=4217 RepID=A0ACB9EIT1_ARCLA|nr:hypothetical protein L6452_05927 [Arctium lappa]